jgi:tripartite-type tricarboxylate transporter receptor subunit TctC
VASAATPAAVLDAINADMRKVMDSPAMKAKLEQFGVEYTSSDRAQFWKVVQEEIERSGKVIREKKLVAE